MEVWEVDLHSGPVVRYGKTLSEPSSFPSVDKGAKLDVYNNQMSVF